MEQTSRLTPDISRIQVDSAGFKVRPKDAWEQYTQIYDYTPITNQLDGSFVENQMWSTPTSIFGQQFLCPALYDHTKKHIRETEHLICIHRYLSGETYGSTEGQPFSTRPGMIVFRDMTRPYIGIQTAGVAQGVYFPSAMIGYDHDRYPGMLTCQATSPIGRILNAEFDYFFDHLSSGDQSIDAHRYQRLVACLTVACAGPNVREDVRIQARNALADLIRDFIEQNLASPLLSTESILREFGVSRASLYRMFESEGGVRNYISRRRLFQAAVDLSRAETVRGKISRTAERWGFSSNANFHRSIKTVFGVKPGSLFEHPLGEGHASHGAERGSGFAGAFRSWSDDRCTELAAA